MKNTMRQAPSIMVGSPWDSRLPRTGDQHRFAFARPGRHSHADGGKWLITD
jgi:hypothetical protein